MEKQKITVTVAGKSYTLVSSDPPAYVKRVAAFVDRKLSETAAVTNAFVDRKLSETAAVTNLPSGQAAVLTCFHLAEELLKAQDENTLLRRQNEQLARYNAQTAQMNNEQ